MNPFPPYDFIGVETPDIDTIILIFANNGGLTVTKAIKAFPLFDKEWFGSSREFASYGVHEGEAYQIELHGDVVQQFLERYGGFQATTDSLMGSFDNFTINMSSLLDGKGLDGRYLNWDEARSPLENWENAGIDIAEFLIANIEELWALFSQLNEDLGFEFTTQYKNPELFSDFGLNLKLIATRTYILQGDEDCYPKMLTDTANDDSGYTGSYHENEMAKFGYKFIGVNDKSGKFIPIDTAFTVEQDNEVFTPVFEPLTGKAHGGVLLVKFQ